MLGFSSLLLNDLGSKIPIEQRNWLLQIGHAAGQMSDLIDALMRLSIVGKQALKVQLVEVAALVHSVVDELRDGNLQRSVNVRVGELPEVMADPLLLRQVFVNLLSNAYKYTRKVDQAEVVVGCEQQGDEAVFRVRDNGSGFDMAHADRLFQAFHRLHHDGQFEGSGVGLSIVQRIVKRHGGRIWAQAAPGKGASFFFTLGAASSPAVGIASGVE